MSSLPPFSTDAEPAQGDAADGWQATRAQTVVATQILGNDEDDAPEEQRDIGRQVSADQRELFVSCDPAEAIQQQFELLHPDYIALHDVGTVSSRKLLAGVAAASNRSLQKLVIRRQGYGTPLATLEFLDFPGTDGSLLRLYTTQADADTTARLALARVLMGYSQLAVLMVGALPAHLLESTLKPLHEAMVTGPWFNRHMLLLPLTATTATLASFGTDMGRGTGVNVRTTPQVTRPADAWGFISGTWNKLREQGVGNPRPVAKAAPQPTSTSMPPMAPRPAGSFSNSVPPPAAPTPTLPLATPPAVAYPTSYAAMPPTPQAAQAAVSTPASTAMRPMPPTRPVASTQPDSPLQRYVNQLIELTGMVSCCVFDIASGQDLVHAGARPSPDILAHHGAALIGAMTATARTMGLGHAVPEAAITLGSHHLLVRPVPNHPGLALHAVLDKTHANLTLVRLQVGRMDNLLD
jgi:hypothetical protein